MKSEQDWVEYFRKRLLERFSDQIDMEGIASVSYVMAGDICSALASVRKEALEEAAKAAEDVNEIVKILPADMRDLYVGGRTDAASKIRALARAAALTGTDVPAPGQPCGLCEGPCTGKHDGRVGSASQTVEHEWRPSSRYRCCSCGWLCSTNNFMDVCGQTCKREHAEHVASVTKGREQAEL